MYSSGSLNNLIQIVVLIIGLTWPELLFLLENVESSKNFFANMKDGKTQTLVSSTKVTRKGKIGPAKMTD